MTHIRDIATAIAWTQTGHVRGREFVALPSALAALRRPGLADHVQARIDSMLGGQYLPPKPASIAIPKKRQGMRDVALLSLVDKVILNWVAVASWPAITDTLSWTRALPRPVDHHEPLPQRADDVEWIENFLLPYRGFVTRGRDALGRGDWVVQLDIANFGPSVSLASIAGRLARADAPRAALDMLAVYQRAWPGESLPIGQVFTDPLLKFYLDDCDRALHAAFGARYFRYVDDMRIQARSPAEAEAALEHADATLRAHGFTLNRQKTFIRAPGASAEPDMLAHAAQAHGISLDAADRAERLYCSYMRRAARQDDPAFPAVFKAVLYALGDRRSALPLADAVHWLRAYPQGGKYVMNYLDRLGDARGALPAVRHAIQYPAGDGGSAHYEMFRRAMRLALAYDYPLQEVMPMFTLGNMPAYQAMVVHDGMRMLHPARRLAPRV